MSRQDLFWDILGISPTMDKTVIKQAFSKLAHETNPEDDPEGYSRLHEAYRAALDYASNDASSQCSIKQTESKYDFTSVKTDDAYTPNELELNNAIFYYKKAMNAGSYADLFGRSNEDLRIISSNLFNLYTALADKTDDVSVWERFFAEPVIAIVMEDPEFRAFLINRFPPENANRIHIENAIAMHEQNIADRKRSVELAREREKKATSFKENLWSYLSIAAAVLAFFALVITIIAGFPLTYNFAIMCSANAVCLCLFYRDFTECSNRDQDNPQKYRKLALGSKIICFISIVGAWICFCAKTAGTVSQQIITLICCLTSSVVILVMYMITRYK